MQSGVRAIQSVDKQRQLPVEINCLHRWFARGSPTKGSDQQLHARCELRVAQNTYRYESNTGFSAEIVVDDLGLVTAYPGGWERIGSL
jgi:hypothetical protein